MPTPFCFLASQTGRQWVAKGMMMTNDKSRKTNTGRGFAAMKPERQREISSEGGRAAHRSGHAHQFTSEEAREAGRKGGQASRSGVRSSQGNESESDRPKERRDGSVKNDAAGKANTKADKLDGSP